MAKATALSIEDAWNSVALEERLELVANCQAKGVTAALCFALYMSAIAYGFDQIVMLAFAAAGALLVCPAYAAKKWREYKPALIIKYLAAHSVCRRYAYGLKFPSYSLVLLFRAELNEEFASSEVESFYLKQRSKELGHEILEYQPIPVWVALLRGGVVIISEQRGGAKLEYASSISGISEVVLEEDPKQLGSQIVRMTSTGISKNRKVWLTSRYPGGLYVFERHLNRLYFEYKAALKKDEQLRLALSQSNAAHQS